MSILGNFSNWLFGTPQNPANAAQPYLNQIPGMVQNYMNPYIGAGGWALPQLQSQYSSLTGNPGAFINQMGTNFHQSPGYQFALNQGLGGINRAAAAGGMAGSPQEQQWAAQMATGYANQDYYNWMNHAMNAYGMGLNGLNSMYMGGMNAANNASSDIGNALMSQANLAYSGANNQNQQQMGQEGALLGFGGSISGSMLGGGSFGMPNFMSQGGYGMP